MKITEAIKAELAQWLDIFWKTYIKGDYERWATFVADDYYNIGGTKEEIWHSKQEILEYSYALQDQMVDQAEIRNRTIEVLPYGDYVMVNEFTDLYVKIEGEWTFYGPFRMSSLMSKTQTGWIALHQHGSYPDMKATEGEAFASDALKAENNRLQEAVDQRTAELQGKNQELEIEASLERVRTVAMGMKTPDDMLQVCRIIATQLEVLGVKQIRNVQTAIVESKEEIYLCYQYFPSYDRDVIERTEYPKSPVEQQMVDQMLSTRDSHFLGALSGEELADFRSHRKREKHLDDPLLEKSVELGYCFLSIGEGGLGLTLYSTLDEKSVALFKRFHQVFSLAYQRFRDIQKAETQAREAEIELALERVRARTMAMHSSSELLEVATVLFQQVKALGVPQWNCGFNIWEKGDTEFTYYPGSPDGIIFPSPCKIPLVEHPIFRKFDESRNRGEELLIYEKEGEIQADHYAYMLSLPGVGDLLKSMLEAGFELPTFQIDHIANFAYGNLIFITYQHYPEMHEVFKRFAKVFEQTYTRFLDLQKAEAQAREARIEAALEKVRSRSLAMHKSDELNEVVSIVFEKLKELQIPATAVGIGIAIDRSKDLDSFVCGENEAGLVITNYRLPYFDNQIPKDLYNALEKQLEFYVGNYSKTEKDAFYNYLIEHTAEFKHLPEDILRMIFDSPTYTISMVAVKNAVFNINDFEGKTLEENEIDIIKRFARVFDQAYTRFLDLKRAEAQAREAQIEVAIERVRAQSMAMHHPDDLDIVNKEILSQLNWLQIQGLTGVTFYLIDENGWVKAWDFSSPGNTGDQSSYTLQFDSNKHEMLGFPFKTLLQTDLDYFVADYPLEKLEKAVYEFEEIDPAIAKIVREALSTGVLTHQWTACCRISNGLLGIDLVNPPSEDTKAIILKMAGAFNQAYTRFLDLQKAEAQARESEIELALERVRARTMAMQRSEELIETSLELWKQVDHLGIPAFGCGFNFWDADKKFATAWMGGNERTQPSFKTDSNQDIFKRIHEAERKGDSLFVEIQEGEAVKEHYSYMNSIPVFKNTADGMAEAGLSFPEFQIMHCSFFAQGYLMFITFEPVPWAYDIFKRFAKVFEQTFTRFLDLQKAEEQAREAQIEAALERIRSRSLAMYKTDDLRYVVAVLFEQMQSLSVDMGFASVSIFIFEEGSRNINQWIPLPDGVASLSVPYFEHPISSDLFDAKENGADYFAKVYTLDEKNTWLKAGFELTDYKNLPEEFRTSLLEAPGYAISITLAKSSGICIPSFVGTLPSSDDVAIMKRVGKVFEQTYTRFLDLQKAEAQVREAQIEAALEKVRSRSLAMHKPDELGEVVGIVLEKLQEIGITNDGEAVLWERKEGSRDTIFWLASDQNFSTVKFFCPYLGVAYDSYLWDQIEKGLHFFAHTFSYEEKNEYYDWAFVNSDWKYLPDERKTWMLEQESQSLSVAWTEKSGITIPSYANKILTEQEGEILLRFSKVFEQAYTRFLDLQKAEEQAREAQIEAALERVRSRSMGMQNSSELKDVIQVVYQQFIGLGIPIEHTGFIMDYKDREDMNIWLADSNQFHSEITFPYFDSPHWNSYLEAKAIGENFFANLLDFETKNRFYQGLFALIPELPKETQDFYFSQEGLSISTVLLDNVGLYIENYTTTSFTDEENQVLMRFGKVFQQTYTRFLDLKKAEVQAKEAQIEAALERVRSRTMAMQKSEDLSETSAEMFKQIQDLGMQQWSCGFNIFDHEKNTITQWLSTGDGRITAPFTTPSNEDVFQEITQAAKRGESLFIKEMGGKELEAHYVYMKSLPVVGDILKDFEDSGFDIPTYQILNIAYFNYGYLVFITYEQVPAAHDLFNRFAKVFDQTYTRFLDLQKAEAQAREAKIEAALERTRTQSMLMKHSDEIKSVSEVFQEQLLRLDISSEFSYVWLPDESTSSHQFWASWTEDQKGKTILKSKQVTYPMDKSEAYTATCLKALETPEVILEEFVPPGEIVGFFDVWKELLTGAQKLKAESFPDGIYYSEAYMRYGCFGINIRRRLSDEEKTILKRFSIEFERAYTRFLDLQKAEIQTRKAHIEVALERVRARALAMQEPEELVEVANVMREEMGLLGVEELETSSIYINQENLVDAQCWYSLKDLRDGEKKYVADHFDLNYTKTWVGQQMRSFHQSSQKETSIVMKGENRKEWINYCSSQSPVFEGFYGEVIPERTYHLTKFSQGAIGAATPGDISSESWDLLRRAASVFSLAYSRFKDLSQAREDLKKLKKAKARAEKALKELKSAQEQLVQQEKLASLGQLTAGIAHEIKNPLNFVNNFSDLSRELIEEVFEELENLENSDTKEEIIAILNDVKSNLTKVHEHGSRADSIVTSMLQHSRASGSKREAKAFNPLVKEFVNLSFHGMRAGKAPINVDIDLQLDPKVGDVTLISEDFSRVILNLCNNAFDAMRDKLKLGESADYLPKLTVKTALQKDKVIFSIADNGPGIPAELRDKILQPFFTTKKGTEGTGLGLSITNDIIKAQGGVLTIESPSGQGAIFSISIPIH